MDNTPRELAANPRARDWYEEWYRRSLEDADAFWGERAREYLAWFHEWDFVLRHDVEDARIAWFGRGLLNASYNCLDRHLDQRGERVAYYWQGEDPGESKTVTYRELHAAVNSFAALLRAEGVARGDCVMLFMPMIVELPVAMLACARLGAVHCAIFSGYSAEYLAHRITDCKARFVVTANGSVRKGEVNPLKTVVDAALAKAPSVEKVFVFRGCGIDAAMAPGRDIQVEEALEDRSLPALVEPEPMEAEDPLCILFTSGAIGNPRPLVHTHGGYLLWVAMATKVLFDLKPDETFWCPSDISWAHGHGFGVYGPLLNGVSQVLFEGAVLYPHPGRCWEIVDRYRVAALYSVPAVFRTLLQDGERLPEQYDLSSLRILGSAGQPLTARVRQWLHHSVGRGRCFIVDTWWQTESGGPIMAQFPGLVPGEATAASLPFFGVEPLILDLDTGEETRFPDQEGAFFISRPWPGMARTILGEREAFREAYFAPFGNMFITGEGAKRDASGLYTITGRIDDVIDVCGRRIGSWEIEAAVASHEAVAEVAAVGFPHPVKGERIYLFVALRPGASGTNGLKDELAGILRGRIGPIATPDIIQWANELPKTRGGKVLRRVLQKIAKGMIDDLGDLSTVANPDAVAALIRDRIGLPDAN